MACTSNCRQPTPAMAHCTVCHRTFGGIGGFDAHRKNGQCVDPSTLGYIETDQVWRTPMSEEARQRLIGIRQGAALTSLSIWSQ